MFVSHALNEPGECDIVKKHLYFYFTIILKFPPWGEVSSQWLKCNVRSPLTATLFNSKLNPI